MQTLWSRAAQAPASCRCRICLHSTNALTRRSTSAASRRKLTVADLFTACYTTILGTAAIIDARRKNERRQALDGELDRARASLKQLAAPGPQSSQGGENGAPVWGTFAPARLPTHVSRQPGSEVVRPLLEELKSLCDMTYRPLAPTSWIRDQIDWADIEASVAFEEQDHNASRRWPRTYNEMADMTATVVDLVDELLRRTRTYPSRRLQDALNVPDHVEEAILTELEHFRNGHDIPGYQFVHIDPSYSERVRTRLNESIRRIFNQAVTTPQTVARICFNLFTAGVPPSIHTYNTMIAGFNRIQRPDLAQAVINSYLDRTRWSATKQTVLCLLNHYRGPGGREGLREIVQRMRGAVEDGLHSVSPCTGRVRKKLRVGATFDHLIRGWLYHEDVGIACMTFVACLREGASIPISTLHELFRSLLATANFQSARKLLVGIVRNFENFKWYLTSVIGNNTIAVVRKLLQSLDQVIDIGWLPLGEIYGQTHQAYAKATISLKLIISRLDAQLEVQEMAQLLPLLSATLNPSESLLTRLELAISGLDKAKLNRRTPPVLQKAYVEMARIISIERRCNDLEEKTRHLVAALKAGIIYVKTGYDLDPGSLLLSDHIASQVFQDQRLALRIALSHIDVFNDLTREDITSQLFQQIPNQDMILQLEETGHQQKLDRRVLASFFGPNAVCPPACEEQVLSHSHQELEQRAQATEDSIRALLFTHLSFRKQRQAIHYHRGYYRIPLRSLVGYIYRSANNHWQRDVVPTTSGFNDYTAYGTPKSLPQMMAEEVASLDHPTPLKTEGLVLATEEGLLEIRRKASHDEEGPPLQHASLG
ncbi:hypothetical protein F5Y10DRAFT_237449 [Nemania abortiva]|nr:hypothetical protein F5Y10DRAFT_237449 [Nemania abortiva]